MHDDMMGESPRELELAEQQQDPTSPTGQDETNDSTTVTTGAANSNSNNNSPVERVNLKESGTGRPANLFNVRFRSHVRASSDTTMISYTKTAATSKLTEVYAVAKDTATPTTPRKETGMELGPPVAVKSHGENGMESGPAISVQVEGIVSHGESNGTESGSNSVEECPIPAPRVELLTIPGRAAGADADKHSLEVSTESNISVDSDRKSAIVDIGYDL